MPSILFVCTANICRSPMAMALFRAKLGEQADSWRVESAGTWAADGEPAHPKAQLAIAERGLDLSRHYSRSVSRELLRQFNLILTMEISHKEALRLEFPEIAARVHLLSEMVGQTFNILDPVGGSEQDFRIAAQDIDQIISDGFERILQLAKD